MQGDNANGQRQPEEEWDHPVLVVAVKDETRNPPGRPQQPYGKVNEQTVSPVEGSHFAGRLLRCLHRLRGCDHVSLLDIHAVVALLLTPICRSMANAVLLRARIGDRTALVGRAGGVDRHIVALLVGVVAMVEVAMRVLVRWI